MFDNITRTGEVHVPGPAAQRGTRLHKNAEDYIKQTPEDPVQLCKEMIPLGPELERMRLNGWKSEEIWLMDASWSPVQDESLAWGKAIIDLHKMDGDVLNIVDLKSGKRYPEHEEQLQIYALMGMKRYKDVKRVDVAAWYIDEGGRLGHSMSYMPEMFDHYATPWTKLANEILTATEFLPTPSRNACRFCPYKASQGGPCELGDRFGK